MKKNKSFNYLIIFIIVCIVFVTVILLLENKSDDSYIELIGEETVKVYQNEEYKELGYNIITDNNANNYSVKVFGSVDTKKIGSYDLIYSLYDKNDKLVIKKVRKVEVIENPIDSVTLSLNGDDNVYVLLNTTYEDLGATAIRDGVDISNTIVVTNNVNTTKIGKYEVIYKVIIDNVSKEIKRWVNVIDAEVLYSVDVLNRKINFIVDSEYFKYILLPDNKIENNKQISYFVNSDGNYLFKVYLTDTLYKEYNVNVSNLDIAGPSGTCTFTSSNNSTYITVNASDDSGIKKYQYDGMEYNNASFNVSGLKRNVIVRVYDNNDNYTDFNCIGNIHFDNNMNDIKTSHNITSCEKKYDAANKELDELMQFYGYKTRDAVAAAALYLTEYEDEIPYSWGGKYQKKGFNPDWGCSTHVTKSVCSKSLGSETCALGLDCTGFTAWAFVQAGFDPSIIRTHAQSTDMWGEFNASKHKYTFKNDQDKVSLIKPGDIVHTEGHVGIVLGTSDTQVKVANQHDGIRISYINKSNGRSTNGDKDFPNFVLFDDFFTLYGN